MYIYKISAGILHIFCIYTENNVYLNYLQNIGIAKKCISIVNKIVNNLQKRDPGLGLPVSHWLKSAHTMHSQEIPFINLVFIRMGTCFRL